MNEIVKYNVNEAEIAKMSNIYMDLTIDDIENQEAFDAVHSGRMVMVKHRTGVEKLRKNANETAQEFIKNNNANAKKLISLMEPIETHLKNEENIITKEKKRLKAQEEAKEKAKIETRVSELFALGVNIPFFDLAMLSENEYAEKFQSAKTAYDTEQIRLAEEEKKKEEEKLELERLRKKKEADRKAESARLEKLAKEQAIEADRLKKVQDDIDAKAKALKDEQDKLEADKKAEQERKDREVFEKQAAERARIQAEKDTIEKAKRENREAKKREEAEAVEKARQAELLPDKTKLLNFADLIHILASGNFSMKSVEAQALYAATLCTISDLETTLRKEIEEL